MRMITRRAFLQAAGAAAAAAALSACAGGASSSAAASSAVPPAASEGAEAEAGVVQTTAGLVQGVEVGGVYRYLGLPYAQAAERFVPAEEAAPWEGVRLADAYGPISPQGSISGLEASGDQSGTDNNCQNLNIWTPGPGDGAARPVMVWLHGAGSRPVPRSSSRRTTGTI